MEQRVNGHCVHIIYFVDTHMDIHASLSIHGKFDNDIQGYYEHPY